MEMECSSWKQGSLLVDNVPWMTLYSRVGAMVPRPGNIGLLCTLGLLNIINMSWYLTALTPHKVKRNKTLVTDFKTYLEKMVFLKDLKFSIAFLMKVFLSWNFCVYLLRTLMPLNDLDEFLFHSLLILLTILVSDSVSCFLSSVILDKLPHFSFLKYFI